MFLEQLAHQFLRCSLVAPSLHEQVKRLCHAKDSAFGLAGKMANTTISFARHQFPPSIIRHAVSLYIRFTLSYRDVEDLLAERGLDVSYETVRRWVLKFGPMFARELRRRRPRPTFQWHLDEMAIGIGSKQFWLWRAVDDEGEVLDLLVQRCGDEPAALLRAAMAALGLSIATNRVCVRTIGQRIRANPCDGASARCNASNRLDHPALSFRSRRRPQSIQRPTSSHFS